jgi:hypothetical protein
LSEEKKMDVLQWGFSLTNAVIASIKVAGERAGFSQVFDAEPDDHEIASDFRHDRLHIEDARTLIGERISDGFKGMAGLSVLQDENGNLALRIEIFDTRENKSIGMFVPMKRSFRGKISPASTNVEIDDAPSIPGVFTPQ